MSDTPALRSTPLSAWHRARGAKMVEYAGYTMPVQYEGTLAEHAACRERVGLFDITHMGELEVTGPGAEAWLDSLVTNKVAGIPTGKVVYTAMCHEDGGVLDDMLVYRLGEAVWLVVCNAANHAKIAAWLQARVPAVGVVLEDQTDRTALIAVQGPDSRELVGRLARLAGRGTDIDALDFYTAFTLGGPGLDRGRWIVSRTGYTGEHGYELYLPNADALPVWEELMARGADLGAVPVGLAARDTLRFEVCYCLYGHELAEDITPLEAGIGWAVKLKKGEFTGRAALQAQKDAGVPRRLVCLEITDRGIARQGQAVRQAGREVGFVTSGTFSPTLRKPLAMALVAADAADGPLAVDVRGRDLACRTVPFPFLPARTKGDPRAERPLSA
ncbi:MAG: glycine cleavage system aminomethyltransferase GcvT [Krumholzibacteria bacterium]|nr:glycine cleavage system aminomethyltransferase GcvT [Candidatus Krumholzibacteria bacterium]